MEILNILIFILLLVSALTKMNQIPIWLTFSLLGLKFSLIESYMSLILVILSLLVIELSSVCKINFNSSSQSMKMSSIVKIILIGCIAGIGLWKFLFINKNISITDNELTKISVFVLLSLIILGLVLNNGKRGNSISK